MNRCKEYNARILTRLFFLAIFTVVVLSFSNSLSHSSNNGTGISEQHKLELTGIIPFNIPGQYNQDGTFIYNLCSKVFPNHDIINIHNRIVNRHFLVIRQTCISLGPYVALKSLFELHLNKDDLPDLG